METILKDKNTYSESSISEFERNKPTKTRKSLVELIKYVEKMQHFDKVEILKKLENIKQSLENGD